MPPKKKGKANKLARMSEEEKLRYLQHRAAIEEEAKRRKEHIIASYMKNKLKHEDQFTRLNTAKINQQWRQTLRQIKNKELHDATETLHQVFEVALKTKNNIIYSLSLDLESAEKKHGLAVQTHMVAIDKILGIQEGRLKNLADTFGSVSERRVMRASEEKARLENSFVRDKTSLEKIIFWEKEHSRRNKESLGELGEDYKSSLVHEIMAEIRQEEMKSNKKMEEVKKEMKEALSNYKNAFKPFQNEYKELVEFDSKSSQEIARNETIIENYKEILKKMKKENESELKGLIEERDMLKEKMQEKSREYKRLKRALQESNDADKKMLKFLSTISSDAIKKLQEMVDKVDRIKHYMDLTSKYLTEDELATQGLNEALTDENVPLLEMTLVWTEFGKLRVEVANMEVIHGHYTEENNYLKQILSQYLNTVARPSSVPSSRLVKEEKRSSSGQKTTAGKC